MARSRWCFEQSNAEQGTEAQKEGKRERKTGWKKQKLEKRGGKQGNSRCDTLDKEKENKVAKRNRTERG
jgi:hypothetical protein